MWRQVSFLLVGMVVAMVFAAAAHGQAISVLGYTSDGNDLGECPSSQVGLAPQSGHWVFSQPISLQTKLVTVEVNVVDAQSKPVGNMDVLAYCEPWDFT